MTVMRELSSSAAKNLSAAQLCGRLRRGRWVPGSSRRRDRGAAGAACQPLFPTLSTPSGEPQPGSRHGHGVCPWITHSRAELQMHAGSGANTSTIARNRAESCAIWTSRPTLGYAPQTYSSVACVLGMETRGSALVTPKENKWPVGRTAGPTVGRTARNCKGRVGTLGAFPTCVPTPLPERRASRAICAFRSCARMPPRRTPSPCPARTARHGADRCVRQGRSAERAPALSRVPAGPSCARGARTPARCRTRRPRAGRTSGPRAAAAR